MVWNENVDVQTIDFRDVELMKYTVSYVDTKFDPEISSGKIQDDMTFNNALTYSIWDDGKKTTKLHWSVVRNMYERNGLSIPSQLETHRDSDSGLGPMTQYDQAALERMHAKS